MTKEAQAYNRIKTVCAINGVGKPGLVYPWFSIVKNDMPKCEFLKIPSC